MAQGINKVILIGRLGADPDVRATAGGNSVANLSLATSESWRDKQSGEKVEKTEWHRVVLFSGLADVASEYLRKGGLIYLEGKLQTRKWQDRDGNDRWTTEVVGQKLEMLGGRNDSGRSDSGGSSGSAAPAPSAGPAPQTAPDQQELEDDIPF